MPAANGKPTKYRKKPVVIETMRFDASSYRAMTEVARWCGGRIWLGRTRSDVSRPVACSEAKASDRTDVAYWLDIPTLEGVMKAFPGDYIIRGVQGEFYPCKPNIFEDTYEVAGP